jgi:hypothetical protein
VITILADHNVEGHARLLLGALRAKEWADLLDIQLVTFAEVGLSVASPDREVWLRVQELDMVLLTENRNRSGADSLEQTMLDSLTPASLPVLTFGDGKRFLFDRAYRKACVDRVVEILTYLEQYRGVTRLYVP